MLLQTAAELLSKNSDLAVLVGLLARLGLLWQRGLSWYEYRTLHGIKRRLAPVVGNGFVLTLASKGGRDDAEFIQTRDASVREVVSKLRSSGGSLHLFASVKQRPDTHGDPLSRAHVVWTYPGVTQTEAYLFANDDGTTDVYAHRETSVTDAVGHLTDKQTDGDPGGVVGDALAGE